MTSVSPYVSPTPTVPSFVVTRTMVRAASSLCAPQEFLSGGSRWATGMTSISEIRIREVPFEVD